MPDLVRSSPPTHGISACIWARYKEAVGHACSQGDIIENRRQGCKHQPGHIRCSSWSLLYILYWFTAQSPRGFEYEPQAIGHFGPIFDQNLPFSKIEFWYALNCVKPSLSWLKNQKCLGALGLVRIVFGS